MIRVNWRGRVARGQQYYEQGEVLWSKVKSLLVIITMLKLLGVSFWTLTLLTPLAVVAYILTGFAWVRWGWYAHGTEIASLDRWTPMQVWQAHMQVRTFKALGLEMNHYPADRLPQEWLDVMASTRREGR